MAHIFNRTKKAPQLSLVDENFNEYTQQSETAFFKRSLNKTLGLLKLKTVFLVLFLVSYSALSFIFKTNLVLFNFPVNAQIYLLWSAGLLLLSVIVCPETISLGFSAALKMRCNDDTVTCFATILAFVQSIIFLIFPERFSIDSSLYIGIIIIYILFNTIFRLLVKKRTKRNFRLVSSKSQKYAMNICTEPDIEPKISSLLGIKKPVMVIKKKTDFLTNFFANSYDISFWNKITVKIVPAFIVADLAVGVFSFVVKRDLIYTFTGMLVFLLLCFPISLVLCLNCTLSRACKTALKRGAMITNAQTIKNFSTVNSIVIDASDLYPEPNVILKEIKTFKGQRVDEAILSAATLVSDKDGTLNKVFDNIIMGQKKILTKASDVFYEHEKGISGWVNGKRTVVGNREILKEYGIDPPSRDYENKYRKDGEGITYIAIGQELVAMFILEYIPNKKMQNELLNAQNSGINILIKTADSNVDIPRITKDFGIFFDNIKILPYELGDSLDDIKSTDISQEPAELCFVGGSESILRSIATCKKANRNFLLVFAIQMTALILAFSITLCLTFGFTLDQVGEIEVILYLFFWTFAGILAPKIKK